MVLTITRPTIQDIADKVSVSRISVWKALNGKPGVSDKLREKILNVAETMGYFYHANPNSENSKTESPKTEKINIAIAVSRLETSIFWLLIVHGVAKQLTHYNINLIYAYLPDAYTENYQLPSTLTDGSVDGVIVLNVYDRKLTALLTQINAKKLFLDKITDIPFNQLNGNLLLIEGRTSVCDITNKLIKKNKTHLCFIGDIAYANTNMDRYRGFCEAVYSNNLKLDRSLCLTKPMKVYQTEVYNFLENLSETPDGIVCANDHIAQYVEKYYLLNKPNSMPTIVGFDNSNEYDNISQRIATVDVDPSSLGALLANKILFYIQYPDSPYEISQMPTTPIYRNL